MKEQDVSSLPFYNLETRLQHAIDTTKQTLNVSKGSMIFDADTLQHYVYIIQKGKIKSYQMNLDSGKEQTLYIYTTHHIIDTVTVLDGECHEVCYEVLEDTQLMVFPMSFIRHLLESAPEFSRRFYLYIAKQMRYLEENLSDISLYSTSQRLIKLITQDYTPENIFRFNILDGLSNTETAKLLGTCRHVVERHLKELKNESLIEVVNRKIRVLEAEKLLQKINLLR